MSTNDKVTYRLRQGALSSPDAGTLEDNVLSGLLLREGRLLYSVDMAFTCTGPHLSRITSVS